MSVLGLKLVNGEDLIGEVREESEYYMVKQPFRVGITQQGMALIPWLFISSQKEFKIAKSNVMTTFELELEVANAYRKQVGSIVLAGPEVVNKFRK